jgi:SAM-dependent methyltransferase
VGAAVSAAFGPLSALFADTAHPRADDHELAFYASRIPQSAGLALDVMCGAGRVLVPRVAQGAKVHGVDQSAAMIARCEAKLGAAGLSAPVFRQDIVQMNLPFRYGAAFIAGGALQLVTDPAEVSAALERIRAHLVPPALLVIDCRIPASSEQRLAAPLVEVSSVKLDDGSQIVRRSETTWTPEARLARAHYRYSHRRGTQRLAEEHEALSSTWYERDEMVEVVRAAGFRDAAAEPWPAEMVNGDAFFVTARV